MRGLSVLLSLLLVGIAQAATINQANIMFPCEAKAVTRIWVDEEPFWSSEHGLMLLEKCDMLELHIPWSESIVVEYLYEDPLMGVRFERVRIYSDGRAVREHQIPTARSQRL